MKIGTSWLLCVAVLTGSEVALAQTTGPRFLTTWGDASIADPIEYPVRLHAGAEAVVGWSFGLCIDPGLLDVIEMVATETTLTSFLGGPPGFHEIGQHPDGFTAEALICFSACPGLPPGQTHVIYHARLQPIALGPTQICYCDTLGTPPVALEIIETTGPVAADVGCGYWAIYEDYPWTFSIPDVEATYDPLSGEGILTAQTVFFESPAWPWYPSDTVGFALGIAHDPAYLAPVGAVPIGILAALHAGAGPDFFMASTHPEGITIGCVYSLLGGAFLQFTEPEAVTEITYETSSATLAATSRASPPSFAGLTRSERPRRSRTSCPETSPMSLTSKMAASSSCPLDLSTCGVTRTMMARSTWPTGCSCSSFSFSPAPHRSVSKCATSTPMRASTSATPSAS